MATPMLFHADIYDSAADAELDYQAIEALHGPDAIGSYDSAIIVHDPDGGMKVTEKPVKHGGWIGERAEQGAVV
jgi:hypothetical protein